MPAQVHCSLDVGVTAFQSGGENSSKIFWSFLIDALVSQRRVLMMLLVDNHLEDSFRIPGISFGILSSIAPH